MEGQTFVLPLWFNFETGYTLTMIGLGAVVIWLGVLGAYKLAMWTLRATSRGIRFLFRGLSMRAKRRRQAQLAADMADLFTEFLEDRVYRGKITAKEAQREYAIFARNHGLWDCAFPRFCNPPPAAETLKERILERLPPEIVAKRKKPEVSTVLKQPEDQSEVADFARALYA
jgi:hypothetical protein